MFYRPKLLGLSAAILLAACATQPTPQVAATETPAEVKSIYGSTCLRETGTRIRLPPGACVPAPGRGYTREEIRQTGTVSLHDALFQLGGL